MDFDLPKLLQDVVGNGRVDAVIGALFARLHTDMVDVDPYGRAGTHGHFTGSALVLDVSGTRTLLTHHRKLDRWLQPGGHADGDTDLRRVALREATEETGLVGLAIEPAIFDLDRHWIPARGEVPGHWHYDVRFVVRATDSEDYTVSEESNDLAWWSLAGVADGDFEASLRRMAQRVLDRGSV